MGKARRRRKRSKAEQQQFNRETAFLVRSVRLNEPRLQTGGLVAPVPLAALRPSAPPACVAPEPPHPSGPAIPTSSLSTDRPAWPKRPLRPRTPLLPAKPALAIAAFCAIIAAPQFIPYYDNWHVFEWNTIGAVLDFRPRVTSAQPLEAAQAALKPEESSKSFLAVRIVDPSGSLAPFWEALWRTERAQPEAVTRILHYGDSPTTADLITADVRKLLQDKFGDAGHGTYLIAKPWAWYRHDGLENDASGWKIDPANMSEVKDGIFGLGGVSFRGAAGATSRIRILEPGHKRVVVSYLATPGAGAFEILAGKQKIGELDTSAPAMLAAEHSFPLPEDAREIRLNVTSGEVRLFGFAFFKDPPGVLYDSLGLNGAFTSVLARFFNEAHWAEELKQAHPQLIIVNYGTNESVYAPYVDTAYEKELKETIRRIRAAVPTAAILIMSPMDRGERKAGGDIGTVPVLPRLIAIQEKVALTEGVAFFNTFEAMGGSGTMGRWYMAEPRLVSADFIHPLPSGARIVGTLFYRALMEGYNRHKLNTIRTNMAWAAQP
jgi:lysophospholipase L1-like esterase